MLRENNDVRSQLETKLAARNTHIEYLVKSLSLAYPDEHTLDDLRHRRSALRIIVQNIQGYTPRNHSEK